MSNVFAGIVERVGEVVEVSEKFKHRKIVITTADQYPQTFEIEFHNDKCNLIESVVEGENISIEANIRGRKWKKDESTPFVVFTSLVGFKIN